MKIFHGWYVLAGLFLVQLMVIGATVMSFGPLVGPISREFSLSRTDTSLAYMAIILGNNFAAPVAGRLLDRLPSALVIGAGGILLMLGGGVIAQAQSPMPIIAAALLLIGPSLALAGPLAAATILSHWFSLLRGRVFGLSATSTSFAGFLIAPTMGLLIVDTGWRTSLLVISLAAGLTALAVAAFTLRRSREQMGLHHDGRAEPHVPASGSRAGKEPGDFRCSREFWFIAISVSLLLAIDTAITISLVPMAIDRGVALKEATLLLSAVSVSGLGGKILVGWLAERFDNRKLMLWVVGLTLILIASLLAPLSYEHVLLLCLISGAATGATFPMGALLMAERFGGAAYGRAVGLQGFIQTPFVLSAIYLAGQSVDLYGSYDAALLLFFGVSIGAGFLVLPLRKPNA